MRCAAVAGLLFQRRRPGPRVGLSARAREGASSARVAAQVLNKALADKDKLADRELLALKEEVLRELGWRHWADLQRAASQQAFPADFATL